MAKAAFLDQYYEQSVDQVLDPVPELKRLNGRLSRSAKTQISQQLKEFGITGSIDDVIKRQNAYAHLYVKGVRVLYPGLNNPRIDTDSYIVFPYNLDPRMSLATLVALQGGQLQLPFEAESIEKTLAAAALDYLKLSQQFAGARNEFHDSRVFDFAKIFMEEYEALKEVIMRRGDSYKSFVLMLAFTAVYHQMSGRSEQYSREKFALSPEFFEKLVPKEIDLEEVLNPEAEVPIRRYRRAAELAKIPTNKLWELVRE